jgi:hypothetical protein
MSSSGGYSFLLRRQIVQRLCNVFFGKAFPVTGNMLPKCCSPDFKLSIKVISFLEKLATYELLRRNYSEWDLSFKQGVRGSSPRWSTMPSYTAARTSGCGISLFI